MYKICYYFRVNTVLMLQHSEHYTRTMITQRGINERVPLTPVEEEERAGWGERTKKRKAGGCVSSNASENE